MRLVVTGSTGLIGSRLVPSLRADGHEVRRLVRHAPKQSDEYQWDPHAGTVDPTALDGIEGAIHLAGAGLGDKRWTEGYKREILSSRVDGTDTLARAMAALDPLPHVLLSASAIGYYGDTGDAVVDESSPRGSGFLAEVVERWEQAADPARDACIRVVHPRTGLVVSGQGGTWGKLLPLFRLGVGGRIGSGDQYWSFVSLTDEVRALTRMLTDTSLHGPIDVTAPEPLTNAEVTAAMGRALKRPAVLPVPGFALRIVVGEFAEDILGGQRVLPTKLLQAGFTFEHPTFEQALAAER